MQELLLLEKGVQKPIPFKMPNFVGARKETMGGCRKNQGGLLGAPKKKPPPPFKKTL